MTRSVAVSLARAWAIEAGITSYSRRSAALPMAVALAVALAGAAVPLVLHAERRDLDAEKSTLTVYVYKSGLFSALADDHVIDATLAAGTIDDGPRAAVSIDVRAADLRVRDPKLSAGKRADVQARMVSPEVLDVEKFPQATYQGKLTKFKDGAPTEVDGQLTLHGVTKPVTLTIRSLKCMTHPMNPQQEFCGADAVANINREDFGVGWGKNFGFAMWVKLAIQIEANRPK